MKHIKISCQKHKLGSLLLTYRCRINYIKTCSFLYACFTETIRSWEFVKKRFMVKTSFIEKTNVIGVHWNCLVFMMQFQCVPTVYSTENKENYFEIDTQQIAWSSSIIYTCTRDHPDFIVDSFMENSNCLKKVYNTRHGSMFLHSWPLVWIRKWKYESISLYLWGHCIAGYVVGIACISSSFPRHHLPLRRLQNGMSLEAVYLCVTQLQCPALSQWIYMLIQCRGSQRYPSTAGLRYKMRSHLDQSVGTPRLLSCQMMC